MDHSIVSGLILHSGVFSTGLSTSRVDVRLHLAQMQAIRCLAYIRRAAW